MPFFKAFSAILVAWSLIVCDCGAAAPAPPKLAEQILEASGVKGGLIVHVGCTDGTLTAALLAGGGFLVHGLDTDAEKVRHARQYIQSIGVYGNVSVDRFDGLLLPYVDNLVNLIVAENLGDITMDEVMRVLCPNGVAYVKRGDAWTKTVKPWPDEIDEWTHYLHDPSNNAVAHDMVVGPPRQLQWVGSPRWTRHHDRLASLTGLVSAGGRIFYFLDEGPCASVMLPPKWSLIARDAFNGTILWKRPVGEWHPHLWPVKGGPAQLPRRLVAQGDRVYVTLGLDASLSALDPATGKTVRTYAQTFATEEVIAAQGVLFLLVTDSPINYRDFRPQRTTIFAERDRVARHWAWNKKPRRIVAIRADSGEALWQVDRIVAPLTLAADSRHIYFHDGEKVVALDRTTGKELWSSRPVEGRSVIRSYFAPSLVVYEDVVLFAGGTRSMTALSAQTGKALWTAEHHRSGLFCPEDLLVIDGVVWSGEITNHRPRDSGIFTGRDLRTGEIRKQFLPDTDIYFMHQRCYRSKATDRYLIPSRTGVEFVDPRNGHWDTNHWVRGGCLYGVMPSNGLLYVPPHSCACYLQAKLNGFCTLASGGRAKSGASAAGLRAQQTGDSASQDWVERGPVYNWSCSMSSAAPAQTSDWPAYRHDAARSGFTQASIPADVNLAWQTHVGGRLSTLSIAYGRLYVAQIDAHTVHAINASSGQKLWSYTAGGRVDSPPTVWQGRVLFGSADGYVYCLRASDGMLAWRFRGAPIDQRLMAFEQIESIWPVPGSVLVANDPSAGPDKAVVCFVAGRSMFLDGGLRLVRLDAKTGRMLSETVLDERDPETGKNLQTRVKELSMPVALPDVLSSDGRHIYMRSQPFDFHGVRQHLAPTDISPLGETGGVHLFSPTGFLDGSGWHRSYWVYGTGFAEGAGGWRKAGNFAPAGDILVFDHATVYGYGRRPAYYGDQSGSPLRHHLFAVDKHPSSGKSSPHKPAAGPDAPRGKHRVEQQPRRRSARPRLVYRWSRDVPPRVRAMALARQTLFVAGPPVLVDEEAALDHISEAEVQAGLKRQAEALEGRAGALLWAVSAVDGQKLAECRLDAPPVWDGMAVANRRLYLSTVDGKVVCLGFR